MITEIVYDKKLNDEDYEILCSNLYRKYSLDLIEVRRGKEGLLLRSCLLTEYELDLLWNYEFNLCK